MRFRQGEGEAGDAQIEDERAGRPRKATPEHAAELVQKRATPKRRQSAAGAGEAAQVEPQPPAKRPR
jgi:hypothetical protein